MPLSNGAIEALNGITLMVEDKGSISEGEVAKIKEIFSGILESGESYDVDEIESWLENEGSWKSSRARVRVVNISHYVQSRYEQRSRFRMAPGDGSCDC